jgi:hypothetical protein
MSALISRNRAGVGAVNENGDRRSIGAAHAIGACSVPPFDLIGDLGEPVDDGTMIMWLGGGHKEIEDTGGFTKRQSRAEFRLDAFQFRRCSALQQGLDVSGVRACRPSAGTAAEPRYAQATNAEERIDRARPIVMNPAEAVAFGTFPILLAG